ncbi:MAG: efflux transporter outer membrane subunit [Caldimonas sp.]
MAAAAALVGCAGLPAPAPDPVPAARPAAAWQAPLPHEGSLAELSAWWSQFDDPLVASLVDAAEAVSPTVASAAARIAEARATRVAAGAALLPSVDASAGLGRGRSDPLTPTGTTASAGLQASWEIDLFGRNRAGRDAAEARLQASAASWHDARVAVAAETASEYVGLRACEARLAQARLDAASRGETSRLTDLSTQSGFESRANAALARAGAAQARASVTQQAEACQRSVKALVALTGLDEPALRVRLDASTGRLPEPAAIAVPSVPAAALAQRPDVLAAAQRVTAASADVAQSEADRLPRVSLAGSIGVARFESSLGDFEGTTWSIGPVSVTLPVFDAGMRVANVAAARGRYDEAATAYAATLRGAIREVETALLALQSTGERGDDARVAADNFEASTRAVEARYKSGFGTLFELEEARRNALLAQNTLIDLRRERVAAWIALYRALGGGWRAGDAAVIAAQTPPGPR